MSLKKEREKKSTSLDAVEVAKNLQKSTTVCGIGWP